MYTKKFYIERFLYCRGWTKIDFDFKIQLKLKIFKILLKKLKIIKNNNIIKAFNP
jgi:hypothetical protein